MARHVLGVLGVIAAGVLLVVSAAMNYRFGFSLGKTPADGQIYGMASAAADCFKALVPFFFFAAWRNRMWSQAFAALVVWVVVTGYSMTSALGHAALNRLDITGQRTAASANHQDLRADSKRAQDQLTWIPAHRPPQTVEAELNVLKAQRQWLLTNECTQLAGKSAREYCQQYHKLSAELASGREARKLEDRIAEVGAKLAKSPGTAVAEADPQAAVLARVTGMQLETVQTALALYVALVVETGSGFGMYVAFAYCRMHGHQPEAQGPVQALPQTTTAQALPEPAGETELMAAAPASPQPRYRVNDNRPPSKRVLPESDVHRFYREEVVASGGSSVSLNDLYKAYCNWAEDQERGSLAMPTFSREFCGLGLRKQKMAGRVRYCHIALRSEQEGSGRHSTLGGAVSKAA